MYPFLFERNVSLVYEGAEARLIEQETNWPVWMTVPSFFFFPRLVSTGISSSSEVAKMI
jgi:hypothetical protein